MSNRAYYQASRKYFRPWNLDTGLAHFTKLSTSELRFWNYGDKNLTERHFNYIFSRRFSHGQKLNFHNGQQIDHVICEIFYRIQEGIAASRSINAG